MIDLKNFVDSIKQLKLAYPNWQVNVDDPTAILVWYDWFDRNTRMDDNGFRELVNQYLREKMYAPHSPRELFEVELELNQKKHLPFAIIWREATRAFRFNEKQNNDYLNWIKVDCGADEDAVEFMMSKEMLYLLQEWIAMDDNDFVDRKMGEKAEKAWKEFLAKKAFKDQDGPMLEKIADVKLPKLE